MARCVSDWMGINCGDIVHEHDNPRHLGRVEAINNAIVKVQWYDSPVTLFSYLPLASVVVVVKARAADAPVRASMPAPLTKKRAGAAGMVVTWYKEPSTSKPTYVAESPRRQLERYFKEKRSSK